MEDVAKFLFEVGMLKRARRTGWWMEGVKDPESIADHLYRAAVLGYILAKMEGADTDKVVRMCLFHDLAEIRLGDLNKVVQRYIDKTQAEEAAFAERKTKEAIVARDADILELLLQAKEYSDNGRKGWAWRT